MKQLSVQLKMILDTIYGGSPLTQNREGLSQADCASIIRQIYRRLDDSGLEDHTVKQRKILDNLLNLADQVEIFLGDEAAIMEAEVASEGRAYGKPRGPK